MTTPAPEEPKKSYMGLMDITNDEYHASPGVSKSHLDVVAQKSLLHYWSEHIDPKRQPKASTPAQIVGTAIHSIILEPDLFTKAYVPNPGIDRRSNAGKADYAYFVAENPGKIILSDDDYQTCLGIRDAVHTHPVVKGLMTRGKSEQSFYAIDEETGELVKCRTDYLHDDGYAVIDVKSTEDASEEGFGKSATNYRYDLQPPWYFDILETLYGEVPRHWIFLAVEKDPPHAMGIYFATPEQMIAGRVAARRDFMRIVNARREHGQERWPDYAAVEARPLKLMPWAKRL